MLQFAPPDIPRLQDATLDGSVLAFALTLTAVASLVFGILSSGRTVAFDSIRAIGGSTRESRLPTTAASSRRRLNVLAAGGLALTMVLLVGAGLLLRSLVARVLVDQGFDAAGALALQVNLPASRYPNPAARMAFHERLLDGGVARAGRQRRRARGLDAEPAASGRFAFNAGGPIQNFDPMSTPVTEVRMVSEGFIEAMGLRLRAGRSFRPEDRAGAEEVMVISELLARQHFPESRSDRRDPLFRHRRSSRHRRRRRRAAAGGRRRPEAGGVSAAAAEHRRPRVVRRHARRRARRRSPVAAGHAARADAGPRSGRAALQRAPARRRHVAAAGGAALQRDAARRCSPPRRW